MDLKRRQMLALTGTALLPFAGCADNTSISGPTPVGDGEVSPVVPDRAIGPDEPEELFVSVTSSDDADTLFDYGSLDGSEREDAESFVSDTDFDAEVVLYAEVQVSDTNNVLAVDDVTNDGGDAVVAFVQRQPTLTAEGIGGNVRQSLVRVNGDDDVESVMAEYGTGGGSAERYEPQSVGDLE